MVVSACRMGAGGSQSAIIRSVGKGQVRPSAWSTFEEFLDGADTDLGTDTDLANRGQLQPQSQYFTNFTHCNPLLADIGSSLAKGRRIKVF